MIVNKDLELAKEKQRRMVAEAKVEKTAAQLDYVAMMADIDIPTDDEEGYNEPEI